MSGRTCRGLREMAAGLICLVSNVAETTHPRKGIAMPFRGWPVLVFRALGVPVEAPGEVEPHRSLGHDQVLPGGWRARVSQCWELCGERAPRPQRVERGEPAG